MEFFKKKDCCIAYHDSGGERSAVVFLHGFPMDSRVWKAQVESLSDTCRCIVPDLRGFGKSNAGDRGWSLALMANDITELLARLGISRAHIVGVSLGGMIAMQFAAGNKELTQSLVVFHAEAKPDDPASKLKRERQIAFTEEHGVAEFTKSFAAGLFSAETGPDPVERLQSIMSGASLGSVISGLELLRDRPDLTPKLSEIEAPTMIVAGELDTGSTPAEMEMMSKEFADARFVVLPGTGHMSIMEKPELANRLLADWLGASN